MDPTTKMFIVAFGFPLAFILIFVIGAYILKFATPTIEKFSKKRAEAEAAREKEFKATYGERENGIIDRAEISAEWANIIEDEVDIEKWRTTSPRREAAINQRIHLLERFLSWLNLEEHPIRILLVLGIIIITVLGVGALAFYNFTSI